ncbi:MAG: PQQ-dependent sugar dehydrogenase [Bacteroidota bacterium]
MRRYHLLFPFLIILSTYITAWGQQFPSGFNGAIVAENLNPTTMVFGPDGRLYIVEKDGKILILDDDQLLPDPFLDIPVDNFNERGLSGLAFHPDYEINNWFYVYYTVPGANRNRISRFTSNGDAAIPTSEEVLLELDPLGGAIHNAGAMKFGADGKLYVAVGDGALPENAANLTTLLGKILRLNDDGTPPEDNPYFNILTGDLRSIYARGLRNPFSMDIQPGTGRIFVNDVGQASFEEVNEIVAGGNYGWPAIEGFITNQTPPQNYQDPVFSYSHSEGCAIVGAAFYNPSLPSFPPTFVNKYFYADFCGGYINTINTDGSDPTTFTTGIDRPLGIAFNEQGIMYFLERAGIGGGSPDDNTGSNNANLWRVAFTGSGEPFIGKQPASVLVPVGESAQFEVIASGENPLSFQWTRNGIDIPGAIFTEFTVENAQLSDDGTVFTCRIFNAFGTIISNEAVLSVTSNTRPVPVISSPVDQSSYAAGNVINFSGSATDAEDGNIPDTNLSWRIDFHHDDHTHPALAATSGISSGTYNIPKIGETSANVWYRVYLTATDSEGLSQTTFTEVFPITRQITFVTNPQGLSVNVNGRMLSTPFTLLAVEGTTHAVGGVSSQTDGGNFYTFDGWQDGFPDLFRTFDIPAQDSTITVNYAEIPVGNGTGLTGAYYSNQQMTFDGTPTLTRLDPEIDFDFGLQSPDPGIISFDNFTARWTGFILPQFSGTYRFFTVSDDGVRLRVNNRFIINQWIPQAATEWSGTIDLEAGQMYPITLDYFELGGEAVIRLLWETDQLAKQVIPQMQLFPNNVTGIEEDIIADLAIYPNPAQHTINIQSSSRISKISLESLEGKRLLLEDVNDITAVLSLANYKVGIYLVRITFDNGSITRLVYKE